MSTNNEKKYMKMSQVEHVLKRSGMYIGSKDNINEDMWIYDDINNKVLKKQINFNPGLLKLFDEILINSKDAIINDSTVTYISVEYNKEENYICVTNDGINSVPVKFDDNHKNTLIPSMIFGELLSSSNYDDDEERITGGTFGIGAKAVNIFSKEFTVEIIDVKNKKKFIQTWTNNMGNKTEPIVTAIKTKTIQPYIKIKFTPDLERFGLTTLDNDHYNLFYRRTIDIAAICGNKIKTYFNETEIKINLFKNYIKLYFPENEVFYDDSCERWEIGVVYKQDSSNEVISFVNGINTYHGGSHVSYVSDIIIKSLINDYIVKKDKTIKVSPGLLKDNLVFFINSTIINPAFSSQTKDTLTTIASKFGSKYTPSATFMKKLAKCGIVEQIIDLVKFKENSSLKKTDGKKLERVSGIPKLDDANKAGTKDSFKCSLILTEGDSAKTFAVSGLSVIGRDYFGVFPLKGKLLNVREANATQILANEEITNLKKIIGLKNNENYDDETKFKQLRYGRIVILCDSDVDGSHIKGLVMNFIHSLWPSLIKRDNFITSLATPIVKANKGDKILSFYNLTEYDNWLEEDESHKNWKIKYYKGLGTSTASEAREYFVDFEKKLINYEWTKLNEKVEDNDEENDEEIEENDEENNEENINILPYKIDDDEDAIKLAFDKTRVDDRKEWLKNYDKNNVLLYENKTVKFSKFVHSDLIHFSNDDLNRSIPSIIDGLKPSQRKILYGAYLRGLDKTEVKVAQLAGFVSDRAAYHHGEASLNGAIIGMAQDYMGSNNINILKPNGQYGTRILNGKDFASPRYIWTSLDDLTKIIFNPLDDAVLNKQFEDNEPIEPEFYAPIIPMILVNGTQGIGTGFSTTILPYNPLEIIDNLKNKLNKNEQFQGMDPNWLGFEGVMHKFDDYNYELYGTYHIDDDKLIITELPVGQSTNAYKEFLEKLLEGEEKPLKTKTDKKPVKKVIKKESKLLKYNDNNTDTKVYFELIFESGYLENVKDIAKEFHLVKKVSITNMHLFDSNGTIKKYDSVIEIMDEYYTVRLDLYLKRKEYLLNILKYEVKKISNKVKFILMIINKELKINNRPKAAIEEDLITHKFKKFDGNYNYLLTMPIHNLTMEKINELKKQQEDKENEYNELEKLTPENIWLMELEKLEKEYNKWIKNKNSDDKIVVKKSKKIKKNQLPLNP
jgi:DNA topoisomerase-2